jgi:hypothetical protein
LGMVEKKRKQKTNSQLLPSPYESRVGNGGGRILFFPCGLRIRMDDDSCDQNPLIVSCHQEVVVALKMIQEHTLTVHA